MEGKNIIMSKRRRSNNKSSYTRKTASAFKNGYLDACAPINPDVVSNLSMKDTYVDVYGGLRPDEKTATFGYYSLERNMCEIDRMNMQLSIDKLKEMTEDRYMIISDDMKGKKLTQEVMRKKRETSLNKKQGGKRAYSPTKVVKSLRQYKREMQIVEKELFGRFHENSVGKSPGEHAPIPKNTMMGTKLMECQYQNIATIPSSSKIETLMLKLKKCWNTDMKGKNFLFFPMMQQKYSNLPFHGIAVSFRDIMKEEDDPVPVILGMELCYSLDRHGRYYACISFECAAPIELAHLVVRIAENGDEIRNVFYRYTSQNKNEEDVRKILSLFTSCIFTDKLPRLSFFTCSCKS